MNLITLSRELSKMYDDADEGEKVAMIHLFGIKNSKIIMKNKYTSAEIIKNTRLKDGTTMKKSYATEISKGVKLGKYVVEKSAEVVKWFF